MFATRFLLPWSALESAPAPDRRRLVGQETDEVLAERYQESGDRLAIEELLRRYLPLARRLAGRYSNTSEPSDDLMQVATGGFLAAAARFDVTRGAALKAFALPTMLGELRRYFRDSGWSIHVPRALQERGQAVQSTVERLTARLGRSPTLAEIAEAIGATVEQVAEAIEARQSYRAASTDWERGDADGDGDGGDWHTRRGELDTQLAAVEHRDTLRRALAALSLRELTIVNMRFREELSQTEIGEILGISQMHVSRLLRRALERMATVLAADKSAE